MQEIGCLEQNKDGGTHLCFFKSKETEGENICVHHGMNIS